MKTITLIFTTLLSLSAWAQTTPIDHVFIVVMENTDYQNALAQPFMGELSRQGALLTNMNGVIHPSQGNYIAMAAGDSFGLMHDRNVDYDINHLGDLLEAKGLTWKVYAEDYPENCFLGARSGKYVRKHVPFLSFKNIQNNLARCNSHIVNASRLAEDIKNKALPNYAMYIPNLDNDGHDTSSDFADRWLTTTFQSQLQNPDFINNTLFVLTFDESESFFSNHVYTALYGPMIKSGSSMDDSLSHYDILKMVEDVFSLGSMGRKDSAAAPLRGIWK